LIIISILIIFQGKIMEKSRVDLIIHPVRLRILQALIDRPLTPLQIAGTLLDVPQATLYRHIDKLAKARVIEVVSERQIRGTMEKVYALPNRAAIVSEKEMAQLSKEDHLRYFTVFVASLLADFQRYLAQPNAKPARDGFGYRKFILNLSDKEFAEVTKAVNLALKPYLQKETEDGRRRRLFATVVFPEADRPIE
jgi:DNA-binding transcriptional ArsR family regulator